VTASSCRKVLADDNPGRPVFAVRQRARELALSLGLSVSAAEAVTIAVSELASNIIDYARAGVVGCFQTVRDDAGFRSWSSHATEAPAFRTSSGRSRTVFYGQRDRLRPFGSKAFDGMNFRSVRS